MAGDTLMHSFTRRSAAAAPISAVQDSGDRSARLDWEAGALSGWISLAEECSDAAGAAP
ncbi:hypothetical protein ACFSUK_14535 [Sphingobium scionense]